MIFNRAELLNRLDGDEDFLEKIIEDFVQDIPRRLYLLKEAIESKNATLAHHQAHTIKGASGMVGAVPLAVAAYEVEMASEEGNLSRAAELVRMVEREFEKLKQAIRLLNETAP